MPYTDQDWRALQDRLKDLDERSRLPKGFHLQHHEAMQLHKDMLGLMWEVKTINPIPKPLEKFRERQVVVGAVKFLPTVKPWPFGVRPWPDAGGATPRDMSWGYVDIGAAGRLHVMAGDWIVTFEGGSREVMHNDEFEKRYEKVEEEC